MSRNASTPAPRREPRLSERRALRPVTVDANQLYSIPETCAALDRSRAGLFKDIASGKLKTVTNGRRRLVPGGEIIRFTTELAASAA